MIHLLGRRRISTIVSTIAATITKVVLPSWVITVKASCTNRVEIVVDPLRDVAVDRDQFGTASGEIRQRSEDEPTDEYET